PGDALEPALALPADPLHRPLEALGVVGAFEVVADLLAKEPARERVVRVAAQPHGPAGGIHGHQHAAGVGAVVGANAAHGPGGRGGLRRPAPPQRGSELAGNAFRSYL